MKRDLQFSARELVVISVVAILFIAYATHSERAPLASAETQFVEKSSGGLNIVPASCESTPPSPHFAGECDPPAYSQGTYSSYSEASYGGSYSEGSYTPSYSEGSYTPAYSQATYSCTPYLFCRGNQVWRYTSMCSEEDTGQRCLYGCVSGSCVSPPSGDGNITVTPGLVRSGETTVVRWETADMQADSCVVVENNPNISDSGSGPDGTFVSSPIRQQTRYSLTCLRSDGSLFVDSATVNVLPSWSEPGN